MTLLRLPTLLSILSAAAFLVSNHAAAGSNPVGDFFKRVGNSIAHPQPAKPVRSKNKTATTGSAIPKPSPGDKTATAVASGAANTSAVAAPTVTQPTVLLASKAPQNNTRRDLPYGIPVQNKPGLVTSPYAPTRGFVDVRGFPSGTEVKDPYTDKIFLAP
jgi:hypothetical protein